MPAILDGGCHLLKQPNQDEPRERDNHRRNETQKNRDYCYGGHFERHTERTTDGRRDDSQHSCPHKKRPHAKL